MILACTEMKLKTSDELTRYEDHQESLDIILKAQSLAKSDKSVQEAIKMLGGGWVGEEASETKIGGVKS